jgi:hypothetical protein
MVKNKQDYKNLVPVFHITPVVESEIQVKCNQIGLCGLEEGKINDDILEIETPQYMINKVGKDTLLFDTINNYTIIGKYCKCNITGNYLISNHKIPVYYLTILYSKKFVGGCLFNIFLYFTLDDETKKKLDHPSKYVNTHMNGFYTLEFVPVDDNFIEKIKPMVEEFTLKKYSNETDVDMDKIIDEINNEMEKFKNFLEPQKFDGYPSKKQVLKHMKTLCSNPLVSKLSTLGLYLREKERKEKKCPDVSYEIPQNIINLDEIKKDPNLLEKILSKNEDIIDN